MTSKGTPGVTRRSLLRLHALPFTIEAELLKPEEFARGYVFADAVTRMYGLPLDPAMLPPQRKV